jgi:2-polyprenyl-3-methyl-5-hydroxy-6-metoxy-1,4-benzoquinol methylase
MADYLNYLENIQDKTSSVRLGGYLSHNFGRFISKGCKVLEIGPGTGGFIRFAKDCGASSVDVIDRDQGVMNYLKNNLDIRNGWISSVEDLVKIQNELDKYDLIFMLQIVEHVNKSALTSMLGLLFKQLNPGGRILITVPNGGNPLSIVERYSDITHENLFSENSLRQIVSMSDLDNPIVKVRGYKIPPINAINIIRIIIQKITHLFLKGLLIANGGVFFGVMEPNITLEIQKPN